jgi:sigma-B regulation protein RsbU (phosphoserine phosphatase)
MESPRNSHPLEAIALGLITITALGTLIISFYPDIHSNGGMSLKQNHASIMRRSRALLSALQLDSVSFRPKISMHQNSALLERMYSNFDAAEANRLFREGVPGYYWKVRLMKEDVEGSSHITLSAGSEAEMVRRILGGDLRFEFNSRGKLIQLDVPMLDSVASPSLSTAEAYQLVRRILITHAEASLLAPLASLGRYEDSTGTAGVIAGIRHFVTPQGNRIDHLFSWLVYDASVQDSVTVHVAVKGNVLAHVEYEYRFTRGYSASHSTGITDVFEAVFFVAFCIILLVVGFRRLRAFEIGFRSAIVLGVFVAILFAVWLYFELSFQLDYTLELLFPLLIAPLFVGGAFVLLWAIGESVGRETWKEKFISFDLLRNGYLLHSRIGLALLRGAIGGFAMLALGLLAAYLAGALDVSWMKQTDDDGIRLFSAPRPALFVIGYALVANLFGAAFMLVGIVSLARQRIRSDVLMIVVPALIFTLVNGPNLVPLPAAWLVILPVTLFLVWLYVKTDVLTAITAMTVFSIAESGVIFLLPGNTGYHAEGVILLAALSAVLAWAIAALLLPDQVENIEDIAPRFQRHITERQRLSRELEIARDVQMSFLPKRNPSLAGLDIASHCAPALEVGGDYYDFIDLGEGRLGVAIGDVSGKGTQAAFYMTLAKGFLQALAWQHDSPAGVLTEMNRLFYRNVERGHFISMIYGVFDVGRKELRVARAGHSPVMHHAADTGVDFIQPRGIALGCEAGDIFKANIEELTVPLISGDVFVFYTDGYPEAMTRAREEYGEERLAETLTRYGGSSAEDILSQLYRETRRFTGRIEQHDDMTMVVVRIP